MKSREVVKRLKAIGGVLVRKDGDHHVYRIGSHFMHVPMGGSHTDAKMYLRKRLERLKQEARGETDADPD